MKKIHKKILGSISILLSCILLTEGTQILRAGECDNWQTEHPEWIWCDDCEDETQHDPKENYEDVDDNDNFQYTDEDAFYGEYSLKQHYETGQVDAGWLIKVKNDGFPDHVFMRWYHKFETGFESHPPKMGRIRYRIRGGDWNTIYAVHCWIEDDGIVALDVSAKNSSQTSSGWLPIARTDFSFAETANIGRWIYFEMEVKVNAKGQTDGLYRLWIDEELKAERTEVDLRGDTDDKINEIMIDCYWNGGSPKSQNRFYDNYVVSTEKIGQYNPSGIENELNYVKLNKKISTLTTVNNINGTVKFIVAPSKNNAFNLDVYNLAGKKIWSYNNTSLKTKDNQIVWSEAPANGIYMAVLRQGHKITDRRFTVFK